MKIKDLVFIEKEQKTFERDPDILYIAKTDSGTFTVLDRMTGFGFRDIETGFRDPLNSELFWLVSGGFDIRDYPELTIEEAINKIKKEANTCRPKEGE